MCLPKQNNEKKEEEKNETFKIWIFTIFRIGIMLTRQRQHKCVMCILDGFFKSNTRNVLAKNM